MPQREYKGGADISKAIKAQSLPTLQVPGYPKAKTGETAVDPRDIYIWQQDIAVVKKLLFQLKEDKKHTYMLVIGQCLPDLNRKLQEGSTAFVQAKADQDVVQLLLWQQDVAVVKKQIVQLEENKKQAYLLVIGQCSSNLDSKLYKLYP